MKFKDYINSIKPYEPGKPIEEVEREYGISNAVKLASNENPLGASKKAVRAIQKAIQKIHLYPDGGCFYLKERLAKAIGVSVSELVIGNGSNEIIELLARGFLSPGDQVIASAGSFLVYPLITQSCGAEFVSVPMKNFGYDLKGILGKINRKTKLIFISNPNNPTGTYVGKSEVKDFIAQVPKDIIICFDEAYFDFVDAKDFPDVLLSVKSGSSNILILRTFSKSYGLAGLRIGYGIACKELIGYLNKVRQPFNVNQLAQVAARAALDDKPFLRKTQRLIAGEKQYLYQKFESLGVPYVPTQANFILFDTKQTGKVVFEKLLKRGIIVRAMAAYGFPNHIRVTIGKRSENRAFIRALQKTLSEK